MQSKQKIPFIYSIRPDAMASGASIQKTLTFASDSYFEWHTLYGITNVDGTRSDGAAITNPFYPNNFKVQITDQSTGRLLTDNKIDQRIVAAPVNGLYWLRTPIMFTPNASLIFDIENISGTTMTPQLAIQGFKIFELVQ